MAIRWNRFNRQAHHWGAIVCALPILVVLITGLLLILKKENLSLHPLRECILMISY